MAESRMTAGVLCAYARDVTDEQRRLGKLLRAFVYGQLALVVVWVVVTTALTIVAPYRFAMLGAALVASTVTLALERRGHVKAAAIVLVTMLWLAIAARVVATGLVSHGGWFVFSVIVGQAGLFIGWRAALVTLACTAALGIAVILLVDQGTIVIPSVPSVWLDWIAGVLVFALIGILQVAAVRLYRGAIDIARRASDRHRALFDAAPIALFELDLRDPERIVTTDVNDAALRLLPSGLPDEMIAVIREQRGEPIDRELTVEGRTFVVRAERPEQLAHVIVGIADVTDQRRLAEKLHDARRLETVASLAGSVAHDFNNLLTVTQMNADRLRRRNPALSDSKELEYIRDANKRAATLTRQLLVFSRRDVAHRQVFAPDGVIAKLEPLLRRTLDPRIELVVESTLRDTTVDMDPAQLELLVTNLANNAADAMTEAGTLRIASRLDGDRVEIVVTDTGPGMTDETRTRAFEPFFTTRPSKRAGLGLSIVQSIATDARGTVVLESNPREGTRAILHLPIAAYVATETAPTTGNERILLVEDDDGVRDVARATLEEAGYAVVAVRNGDEALATMTTNIDLVVSDLVMPGIGGRDLVGRLRTKHPSVPVLYVSGHAADGPPIVEGETRVGFLAKPFTAAQLLASVRSVLP
jgi:signal transduction histidine kinase/CheY-like chemotaxis protein